MLPHRHHVFLCYIIVAVCLEAGLGLGLGRHASVSLLLPKQSVSTESEDNKKAIKITLSPKQQQQYQSFRQTINELVTGVVRRPARRRLQHVLYW
jgi:hypothetical protein